MKGLHERVDEFYRDFSEIAGPFVLFALLEREESAGRWDLVVSAEWPMDARERGRLQDRFFKELQARLGAELVVLLSRVVLLEPDDAFVRALDGIRINRGVVEVDGTLEVMGFASCEDRWVELKDWTLNGMPFRHAVIYECNPVDVATRPLSLPSLAVQA